MRNSFLILSLSLVCVLAIGCEPPSTPVSDGLAGMKEHDDHGHDHDEHGHADHDEHMEEMGPNKGHIIRLKPTDYVAEWRHYKGNNVIRVYVLDANKKTVGVNAKVTIKSESGKSKEVFELEPEDGDAEGKTGVYMLDEQALATAMNLGVVLSFEIDGKVYEGEVPPHKPHHH